MQVRYFVNLINTIAKLSNKIVDLQIMVEMEKRHTSKARKGRHKAEDSNEFYKNLTESRWEKWQQDKLDKEEFRDALREQICINRRQEEIMEKMKAQIAEKKSLKKMFKGRGGGQWPLWVVLLICELLVNGTDPAVVPSNIATMWDTFYDEEPAQTPCVNFVRECRVVIQIIGETVVAMRLAEATLWKEIFFDATTCRQTPFQAILISIIGGEDGKTIEPIVLSSCIFMEDKTAEKQAEGMNAKVRLIVLCTLTIYSNISLIVLSRFRN